MGCNNHMMFMKAKWKALHLRTNNPGHQSIVGTDHLEGTFQTPSWLWSSNAPLWQGRLTSSPGCVRREVASRWREMTLPLYSVPVRSEVLCPVLGSPIKPRCGFTWESPVKGCKDDERIGASLLWGRAGRTVTVQPGEEMIWGDLSNVYKHLKGG